MADETLQTPTNGLRLFLDSADPEAWQRFLPLGLFYGVTTNPLLLERAGQACTLPNLEKLTRLAFKLGAKEIHLQSWGRDQNEMTHMGSQLALMSGLGGHVAVKVPASEAGFAVATRLQAAGCRLTITAVYAPGQVLAAAGLGAAYAAPYLGRLMDAGRDGVADILTMDRLVETAGTIRLLTASLRSAAQVIELATQGLDTFTFGPAVAAELFEASLTDDAAADFQRAAEKMSES